MMCIGVTWWSCLNSNDSSVRQQLDLRACPSKEFSDDPGACQSTGHTELSKCLGISFFLSTYFLLHICWNRGARQKFLNPMMTSLELFQPRTPLLKASSSNLQTKLSLLSSLDLHLWHFIAFQKVLEPRLLFSFHYILLKFHFHVTNSFNSDLSYFNNFHLYSHLLCQGSYAINIFIT